MRAQCTAECLSPSTGQLALVALNAERLKDVKVDKMSSSLIISICYVKLVPLPLATTLFDSIYLIMLGEIIDEIVNLRPHFENDWDIFAE